MAAWNELNAGNTLVPCPVCQILMNQKKRTTHLIDCCEKYAEWMADNGLMKCPLYHLHIIPKAYLNHHLDGNCEEASNMLRKYFQVQKVQLNAKKAPDNFLEDVPDDVLSKQNKQLLYLVKRNLNGADISNDKTIYPDE